MSLHHAPRILFWPELENGPGFVLGWKSQDQVVVVGIILGEDKRQELETINNCLEKLIHHQCCCCSCGDVSALCPGCIRTALVGLEVLAYYDPSGSLLSKITKCGLPMMTNANGQPYCFQWLSAFECQLALYDRTCRIHCGFLQELPENSKTRISVIRIHYAPYTMEVVRRALSNDFISDTKNSYIQRLMPTTLKATSSFVLASRVGPIILEQSMFFQHLRRKFDNKSLSIHATSKALSTLFFNKLSSCTLGGICRVCEKETYLAVTHDEYTSARIQLIDVCSRFLVDTISGVLVGVIILSLFWETAAWQQFIHSQYDVLRGAIDWLNSFPAGFKLNQRMTATMSYKVLLMLKWHEQLIVLALGNLTWVVRPWVVILGGVGMGGSGLLALLFDVVQLSASHLFILTSLFGYIFNTELLVIHALWCLFRGKKRNVLRQRTDTMEYDSTQLLFGTILFVAALFLFTTIAVYHGFFALVYLSIEICLILIMMLYVILLHFPFGRIVANSSKGWKAESIVVEQVEIDSSTDWPDVTRLRARNSHTSIVGDCLRSPFKPIFVRFINVALDTLSGKPNIVLDTRSIVHQHLQ